MRNVGGNIMDAYYSKMCNVAIMTCNEEAHTLVNLLNQYPNSFHIVCMINANCNTWQKDGSIISIGKGVALFQKRCIDRFIIPSLDDDFNERVYRNLMSYGIPNNCIYYAPIAVFRDSMMSDGEKLKAISLFSERREIQTIELHVAEHCNLNCKNCSMFCGLVNEPSFPNLEKMKKGLMQLKKYIDHVKKVRIIGGEPLLNPDLYKYIELIRNMFPYTDIRVITNGLLVTKMNQKLIDSLRNSHATFIVTGYKPIMYEHEKIHYFLESMGIKHEISDVVTEFQKIYNYRGESDIQNNFKSCHWKKSCATFYNGFIATCFVPFVIHYLSDAFSLAIQQSGVLDLFGKDLTTAKIHEFLNTPFELCQYCNDKRISAEWELVSKESGNCITDWSI